MDLVVPGFEATAVLLPYAIIAVTMVVITVVVLGLVLATERRPPLVTQMLLTVAVVGGGSVLLLALVFAFVNTNRTDAWTWVLMAFNFMMAVPVGLWFVAIVVYQDRRVPSRGWVWPLALAAATTASEVLMGVLFAVGEANGGLSTLASFGAGLSSVWYYWSMAAVMAGLLLWARLLPSEKVVARGLLLTALFGPWVSAYPTVGGIAVTVVMAAVVATVLRLVFLRKVGAGEGGLLLGVSVAFLGMTLTGLGLAVSGGSDGSRVAFGLVMGAIMTGEIAYLVRACYGDRPSPVTSPTVREAPAAGKTAGG